MRSRFALLAAPLASATAQDREFVTIATAPPPPPNNTFPGLGLSPAGSTRVGQSFTAPLAPPTADGRQRQTVLTSLEFAFAPLASVGTPCRYAFGVASADAFGGVAQVLFRGTPIDLLDPAGTVLILYVAPGGALELTAGSRYLAFVELVDRAAGDAGLQLKYATANMADTYGGGGTYAFNASSGVTTVSTADLYFTGRFTVQPIPEPSAFALGAAGLALAGAGRLIRRRTRPA